MSEFLRIQGGARLVGAVPAGGSKNAVLALMAGAMLLDGETVLDGAPRISDVEEMRAILAEVGVASRWAGPHRLALAGGGRLDGTPPAERMRRLRASIYIMGPMLARRGRAEAALPGGCRIGSRPVDLHLKAFAGLGARTGVAGGNAVARGRLRGGELYLTGPFGPSVGATVNALLAAATAPGVSRIHGAAREPEVWELARFLNRAGARIAGAGTDVIEVEGVRTLRAVDWDVPPDRIEGGTLLLAAAATGGDVAVTNLPAWTLSELVPLLQAMGCYVEAAPEGPGVRVAAPPRLRPVEVATGPFPGLATDLQPVLAAALLRAGGTSVITETVFDGRFGYLWELERLGARVKVAGRQAAVVGVERLSGAAVEATDLRAAAALTLAGLTADGETAVSGLAWLDRGYADFAAKLRSLGAQVERAGAAVMAVPGA